jgi:hypothetical protein
MRWAHHSRITTIILEIIGWHIRSLGGDVHYPEHYPVIMVLGHD